MAAGVSSLRTRAAIAYRYATSDLAAWPELDPNRPKAVVTLAADYGNLGDVAITHAQMQYLRRALPGHQVLELPISQVVSRTKGLRARLGSEDVITIVGGGNTGDIYDDIESLRQLVVRSFPDNRIVSFPQSVSFSDTLLGRLARRRAASVYRAHRDLHLVARDRASLRAYNELDPGLSVSIAPDIVLSLDESCPSVRRFGIVLSLRNDCESDLTPGQRDEILRQLRAVDSVTVADTHIRGSRLTVAQRQAALRTLWDTYRGSTLVVTDRLHGVIFSVITGTPCIALDSHGSKVSQFYQDWLGELDTVRMLPSSQSADIGWVATQERHKEGNRTVPPSFREEIDAGIIGLLPPSAEG